MASSLLLGVFAATLAAVSWSLGFIVPFVIGGYSLFDVALVEFLISGALGGALLCRHAAEVRRLSLRDWVAACSLGVVGYLGYFLAVMGAATYAGPVIAPAFLGLVPVVLAVAGNVRERTVAWRALALPLVLAVIGLSLVNGGSLARVATDEVRAWAIGVPLALLAVGCWTAFGLMNHASLVARPQMDAGVWAALILVGAGIAMLVFLPLGLAANLFEFPRLGLRWSVSAPLFLWGGGLALVANLGGAMAWTFASQRLPVALSAQLITLEPISGTVLGLLVHRRAPTLAEAVGMLTLLAGVAIAIRIFTRAAEVRALAVAGAGA